MLTLRMTSELIVQRQDHYNATPLVGQAKSQFKRRSTANNVEIIIPVPMDADSPKFKTTVGSCKYVPELNSVIWSIKSFPVSVAEWREGSCSMRLPGRVLEVIWRLSGIQF